MTVEIVVPALGESVTEATVAKWFKAAGDAVARDEVVVELETEKVNVEVAAEASGVLSEILVSENETAQVGAVLGRIDERAPAGDGEEAAAAEPAPPLPAAPAPAAKPQPAPAAPTLPPTAAPPLSPAVRRLVAESGIDVATVAGGGKGGRLLKGDVLAALGAREAPPVAEAPAEAPLAPAPRPRERREPMSRLRRRLAERLKQAQNTAAMLTTFNEADMSRVLALRAAHRERFEARHGLRLGFMAFFVKAAVAALREQPAVNAEIDGDDVVYKDYYDIGVAVAAPGGLVVPVVRDADAKSFAAIETEIADLGARARDGKLTPGDMTGGTFTITNGGVFGSLLSTPILNAPQSGIFGMHKIERRPVAVGDAIELRPMMYLALTYDHRIVDGREAVTFLVRIKELIEDPERLLLDV